MDTIRTTAWRRAGATSALACLAGLTLAGCGSLGPVTDLLYPGATG